MEKWKEWLVAFFSGLLPGLALWIVQKFAGSKKEKIDFINSVLEARLKITELTTRKIEELEQETTILKQEIKDMIKRYTGNLDDCMKHTQNIQELNVRLNHTLLEVTEELNLYKQELERLKNLIKENPET